MKFNVRTADLIVKVALGVMVLVLYFTGVISGPLAGVMVILAAMVLLALAGRLLFQTFFRD